MNNKHLSWNKEINYNFIIASRAYFLQRVHVSKFHLPLFLKTWAWHLCKPLLPSAKGLSIYFYVVSSPSQISVRTWEHCCHADALCVANVGCIMTGSFLPWITMFSHYLKFGGAPHLCFAVLERASEVPLLSYCIMVVLTTCCCLRCLIFAR